jgi:hypothetical protein
VPQKSKKCSQCPALIYADNKSGLCRRCLDAKASTARDARIEAERKAKPEVQVAADRDKQRSAAEMANLRAKYEQSLKTIEQQERELRAMNVLDQGLDTFKIDAKRSSKTSEATVVAVGSDWHVEENVGAEVGGLNFYTVDVAKERTSRFFRAIYRLTTLLRQDVAIDTVVLALLGDFISNDIHEEFPEVNELQPIHAIVTAQNFIISGIEFLLANNPTTTRFVIPCHSGNHARTTRTTRFSSENGHSLEYLMYLHLAAYFRAEPRVQFIIPEGMHSYLDVYETTIRFQHGHAIKYGGGVGGIYIPVNKAIGQWNKARRADLDVFGHFHQMRDGGNFICNGSLIGYNAFALSIKADYEPPKQALFLMDKKRGRTCTWPILVK